MSYHLFEIDYTLYIMDSSNCRIYGNTGDGWFDASETNKQYCIDIEKNINNYYNMFDLKWWFDNGYKHKKELTKEEFLLKIL